MNGSRKAAPTLRHLVAALLCMVCVALRALPATPLQAQAAPGAPALHRHHVIFLLDQSWSAIGTPDRIAEFQRVLREDLEPLLRDRARNGVGVVYDSRRDMSSALAFGLFGNAPYFSRRGEDGFFRVLWIEQPSRHASDLLQRMPWTSTPYTGQESAFRLAIPAVRAELKPSESGLGFERTFLVKVTDNETNLSRNQRAKDYFGEMEEIAGGGSDNGVSTAVMDRDRQAALASIRGLQNFYDILPVGNGGAGIPVGRRLVVLIRELVPKQSIGADMLARRPGPEVEMIRGAGEVYSARLAILPRAAFLTDSAYQWVGVGFRARATDDFEHFSLPAPGQPASIPVTLPRARISGARGEIQLSFVRRDPVYGQAVQRIAIPLRFHREPDEKIAGVVAVAAWMIPAGFSQSQVAGTLDGLLGVLVLWSLWMVLFPAPRAAVELAGFRGGDDGEPLVVDFTREAKSDDAGGTVLLGTLRLVKAARRGPFPRVERRFDVRVGVDLELPAEMTATPPVVGLSDQLERVRVCRKVPHGSEQVMLLRLGALHDYAGDPAKPVDCRLTVRATQLRTGWLRRGSRPAGVLRRTLAIRFVPEAAAVQAALLGGTAAAGGLPPRSVEHRRGTRPLLPPFALAARSTASRTCSRSLDARIEATLYHLDRTAGSLPGAVEIGEGEDGPAETNVDWAQDRDGAFYPRLQGIRARADGGWAALVPLWLNFEVIPLPGVVGDEYVLEVSLFAEDGEGAELWPTVTIRHSIRVEADSRRPDLLFQVSVSPRAHDPAWRTFDRDADGPELVLDVVEPLRWNVGNPENTVDFVALRIDNVARSGGGRVSLALLSPVSVAVAPAAEKAFEPAYTRERRDILAIRGGGRSTGLGELARDQRWVVPSDAPPDGRPIELFLSFRESALKAFDRRIRRFAYVCRLPFRCTIEGDGGAHDEFPLTLQINFAVQRYTGEHVLAIDFGTSATVAAFAASMDEAAMHGNGKLPALLDLQARYATVLRERGVDSDGTAYSDDEALFPNREAQTPFIPSQLVWRRDKKIGEPDFVDLPATAWRVMREFGRAVFYLKGLILDGRYELPEIQHYSEEGRVWLDERGVSHRDTPPPIDGVIRSAYRCLIGDFVEPELNHRAKHLDKVVLTHPNNFHLHHLDRVRGIFRDAFGERFDVQMLSESNAVALYCSYPPDRFDPGALSGSRCRKYLVYDIGAGTLDVTYTELKWADESEANRLREMEVLFKSGVPSGGNRLDIALARVLDAKIRLLERQLNEAQVGFRYTGKIVSPDREGLDAATYPQRMLPVKFALMRLKEEVSAPELHAKPFTLHVPIAATLSLQAGIVQVENINTVQVREILQRFGVKVQGPFGAWEILIPLTSDEIFTQPVVREWLRSVTDEPIADLAHALKLRGLKPEIDCLVLSGRTSQFPPVRERLLTAIETHLGIPRKRLREATLTPAERKAAVGLGALYFGLIHRHVHFVDRSIWARYGVVYQTGSGRRFQEFFSHATAPNPSLGDRVVERDGLSSMRLSRTHEITHAGGPASVVVTYSRDPDLDLKEPDALQNGRFVVVKPLGSDVLGTGLKVRVTLGIDDEDRLTIGVDADGRHIEVDPRPVPMVVPVPPQWAWPFTPLEGPISLLPPPGKVSVPSLGPLPTPESDAAPQSDTRSEPEPTDSKPSD